jgi:hypothetical protein
MAPTLQPSGGRLSETEMVSWGGDSGLSWFRTRLVAGLQQGDTASEYFRDVHTTIATQEKPPHPPAHLAAKRPRDPPHT